MSNLPVIGDPSFARAHTIDHHLSSSSSHTLVIRNTTALHTFEIDALKDGDGYQAISGSSLDLTKDESSCLLQRWPVSTCNGLILVVPFLLNPLEIWNPWSHERLQLPQIDYVGHAGPVFTGLGYDHAAQDFKAVVMDYLGTRVYSLRSDKWRKIDWECPCINSKSWAREHVGVFVRRALHWLLFDSSKIIALDLGTEKHRHIELNALPKTLDNNKKYIDVLGGCLVLSGYSASQFDVWVMKDYGSDDESWIKLFSINRMDEIAFHMRSLRPLAYIKDKRQVFLKDGGCGFFLFDMEGDSMKWVRIHGLTGNLHSQIIPRSTFRLRDNCGGRGKNRMKPSYRPRKMKVSLTIKTMH